MRKKEREKQIRIIQETEEKRRFYNKTHPEEVKERKRFQQMAKEKKLMATSKRKRMRTKKKLLKRLKALWKQKKITTEAYKKETIKTNRELQELK